MGSCVRSTLQSVAYLAGELIMKFMLTFDWQPNTETRRQGIERFRSIGGQMPEGVRLLGRWTKADLSGGFDLLEADDPKALAAFAYQWSDLMQLKIVPIVEDQELAQAVSQ